MQCPTCSTWKPKRRWSKTQWCNSDPFSQGWHGCKDCRARADSHDDDDSHHMSIRVDIVAIQDKLMGVANSAPPVFMDFVAFWMAEISGYDRKAYSHLGYVHKFPGSPVHWQDPAGGGGGFDPGNLLYARAVHLATNLPVTQLFSWNDETLGDVMEGMLAYFAVRRAVSVYHADMGDWLNLLGNIVWEASRDTNDWSSLPLVWLARLGLTPSPAVHPHSVRHPDSSPQPGRVRASSPQWHGPRQPGPGVGPRPAARIRFR